MAHITATNGPHAGRRYDLKSPMSVLGRQPDCEIVIDSTAVSRQHAQIVNVGRDYYLEDLESRNGTFLNERSIQSRHRLRDGDVLRVSDVAFTFSGDQPLERKPHSVRQTNMGSARVLIQEDMEPCSSRIMSRLDISGVSTRGVQLTASAEATLAALLEITRSLGKALALDEVLPQVLNSLFKIFMQADRGFIVMRGDDDKILPMWTKVRHETTDDTIRISRTIVDQVMDKQEAILSADAATDQRFEESESISEYRIRSMMCAPLVDSQGRSIGVLQIDALDQNTRFQQEDLAVLASVATQAGIALDNARMHEQALRRRALERDLEVSREVQRSFLPERPLELLGYEFFDYYEPAIYVGGDYFDYIRLPDGRIAVVVADVVGHGIAAALLMAKLSAEVRFCLASEARPAAAVMRLNDAMSRSFAERFVTMIMVVLNPATNEAVIVSAGHMAPMHRSANGQLDEPGADLLGLPLGIEPGFEFPQKSIILAAGDLLTLYTDGINECLNASGKMYGIQGIRNIVLGIPGKVTPRDVGKRIVEDVRRFLGDTTQVDDMCLVCFGRT